MILTDPLLIHCRKWVNERQCRAFWDVAHDARKALRDSFIGREISVIKNVNQRILGRDFRAHTVVACLRSPLNTRIVEHRQKSLAHLLSRSVTLGHKIMLCWRPWNISLSLTI